MNTLDFLTWLEQSNEISLEALRRLKDAYLETGHEIDIVATELGILHENEIARLLAQFIKVEHIENLLGINVDIEVGKIDTTFLRDSAIFPYRSENGPITVLVANPFAHEPLEALEFHLGLPIKMCVATRSVIQDAFNQFFDVSFNSIEIEADARGLRGDEDLDRLKDFAREAPIIKLVNRIIQEAIDQGTTDVHIEPYEDQVRIRYRLNGVLTVQETAPISQLPGISTRIKILSKLNISERRMPQDGRMRLSIRGNEVDFRVSVMPSIHGETIVIRILDRDGALMKLNALGFDTLAEKKLKKLARKSDGILLITGPTGSGKTTTLYSLLTFLNTDEVKIFTVEDPVEYRLDGITQLQIDTAIELSFARALRSVLRQDPDIILVGEIRDAETAKIAVQAALTGHLVLTTLHTNSAAGAITRLRDMGVEQYLISSIVRGVIGQRLLRTVCSECNAKLDNACKECFNSGYSGRTVAYEIGEVKGAVVESIVNGCTETEIENALIDEGMEPISLQAKQLVEKGLTTQSEYSRVLDLGTN